MIRNFESLAWLKEKNYTDEILTDYNMYVFNHSGKAFLKRKAFPGLRHLLNSMAEN